MGLLATYLSEAIKLATPRLVFFKQAVKGSKHANMKEPRAATPDQVLRIAFAFDPQRVGILLVAGDKSGVSQKRFYKQLIEKADRLYKAHLAKLKARHQRKEK